MPDPTETSTTPQSIATGVDGLGGSGSAPEELSLADHEAQFGSGASAPSVEPAEPELKPAASTEDRDPATGRFTKPTRHRAKSQQASPEDVPRINALTQKLRIAEEELEKLRASAAPKPTPEPARVEPPKPAPTPQPAATTAKPKPTVDQFSDYGDFVDALADWKIAEARREDAETRQRERQQEAVASAWKTKVDAAKDTYSDYDQVALLSPTNIPQGSLLDAWILDHDLGAHILYELQKHPDEVTRILALPVLKQAEELALLSQRLRPSSRSQADRTGAAASVPRSSAPRPATPVRTGPQRASEESPGDDASIADHEKFFGPAARRH